MSPGGVADESSAHRGPGRPRSEVARQAVLEAVDDLLVEVGYSAMSMLQIAERAGVGRQTLYRWWSNKAEILLEASRDDAEQELTDEGHPVAAVDMLAYLMRLTRFLVASPSGVAYRALIGEAQHDLGIATLLSEADVLEPSARRVLVRVRPSAPRMGDPDLALAQFLGPVLYPILLGPSPLAPELLGLHVDQLLRLWGASVDR